MAMGNFTVAVAGLDFYYQKMPNSFNLFEEFCKIYKYNLKILAFTKSNKDFDAYIGDVQLLRAAGISFLAPFQEEDELSIVVPALVKVSRAENLMAVSSYSFLIIFNSILLLFTLIQTIILKLLKKEVDIFGYILAGFLLLLGLTAKLPKDRASRLLYIFLMIHGMLSNINYSAKFGSILIKGRPYINASIYCTKLAKEFMQEKLQNSKDFKFEEVAMIAVISNLTDLNTEHGYCTRKSMWNSYFHFQKRFRTNIFRLAVGWVPGFTPNNFIVFNNNTKLKEELKNYTRLVYTVGLNKKWFQADIKYIKKLSRLRQESQIVSFEDIQIIFKIVLIGYWAAGVSFLVEKIYHKFFGIHRNNNLKAAEIIS